jgi:integrase
VFGRILETTGLARRGRNFHALRHTWQTVAENAVRDMTPIHAIMGHADGTMNAECR